MGLEVAVGFLIAWVVGKARRAGKQLDGVVDEAVDVSAIRVKDLLLAKLSGDSAVQRLQLEAAEAGTVSDRTRIRVEMALDDAAEQDAQFAAELTTALKEAEKTSRSAVATNGGIAISGGVHSTGSGMTIGVIGGNVTQGAAPDPHRPDRT